jgi:hypothetical protein
MAVVHENMRPASDRINHEIQVAIALNVSKRGTRCIQIHTVHSRALRDIQKFPITQITVKLALRTQATEEEITPAISIDVTCCDAGTVEQNLVGQVPMLWQAVGERNAGLRGREKRESFTGGAAQLKRGVFIPGRVNPCTRLYVGRAQPAHKQRKEKPDYEPDVRAPHSGRVLKKASAGDSPAPVGDPPTGIAKMPPCEKTAPIDSNRSLTFRPASRRSAQASRLCYPKRFFKRAVSHRVIVTRPTVNAHLAPSCSLKLDVVIVLVVLFAGRQRKWP